MRPRLDGLGPVSLEIAGLLDSALMEVGTGLHLNPRHTRLARRQPKRNVEPDRLTINERQDGALRVAPRFG